MRAGVFLRNRWASHVTSRETVTEIYDHLVAKGVLEVNKEQRMMAEMCSPLLSAIRHAHTASSGPSYPVSPTATSRRHHIQNYAGRLLQAGSRLLGSAFPNKWDDALAVSYPENIGVCNKRGLYICGDVGIGKTLILDLFDLCDVPLQKRRSHLHAFMSDIADRLVKAEIQLREHRHAAQMTRVKSGVEHMRPMDVVVQEVLTESPVLCFDEFQTFDVAHAALLASFFTRAFRKGMFLITTSNRQPEDLCTVSASFSTFLPHLYTHCRVVHVSGIRDHRQLPDTQHRHRLVFLHPNTKVAAAQLTQRVARGFPERDPVWITEDTLWHHGRCVVIPYHCHGVAAFDFQDICGTRQDLSSADFQLLACHFHTVILFNVPQISTASRNAAHQFIVLVDELYQYSVKLLFTSEVPWDCLMNSHPYQTALEMRGDGSSSTSGTNLYYSEGEDDRSGHTAFYNFQNDEELVSFSRIASRLTEMGCTSYLLRDHDHFTVSDYSFTALLDEDKTES